MRKYVAALIVASLLFSTSGCATWSRSEKGTVAGAATGAAIGAIIGKQSGHTAVGALIGAMVGGAAGAYIGRYMDKQAEEIERDIEGAKVERIGEGIKITFSSGILFDIDKATLKKEARDNLDKLAKILIKYPDTDVLVEGHTDSTGSEEHNLELSRIRAQAVANYLANLGVDATRFTIMGYGESQPVASNDTPEGRQANRRVEIAIMANEKLKKIAKQKAEG